MLWANDTQASALVDCVLTAKTPFLRNFMKLEVALLRDAFCKLKSSPQYRLKVVLAQVAVKILSCAYNPQICPQKYTALRIVPAQKVVYRFNLRIHSVVGKFEAFGSGLHLRCGCGHIQHSPVGLQVHHCASLFF